MIKLKYEYMLKKYKQKTVFKCNMKDVIKIRYALLDKKHMKGSTYIELKDFADTCEMIIKRIEKRNKQYNYEIII